MYHCANVVSDPKGFGSAVLIRAIEPIEGIDAMKRRRAGRVVRDLARGPGRLCHKQWESARRTQANISANRLGSGSNRIVRSLIVK